MYDDDILQEISYDDLPKLRDFYEKHKPYATHVYSFLNTSMKWIKARPDASLFTFYAPNGDWGTDGTFFALMQFSCYDIFLFTMDKTCKRVYEALIRTRRFDWKTKSVLFYALHKDHVDVLLKAMADRGIQIHYNTFTDMRWMPKERAKDLTAECPEGFYIATLETKHAKIVNDNWVHNYEGSESYIATFIELNGGHGVFRESDGKLVAWVLKNLMGVLGILKTLDEFTRKGFASLVVRSLSKEIALEGHDPLGTVLQKNSASQSLFDKLGFETLDSCSFVGAGYLTHRSS